MKEVGQILNEWGAEFISFAAFAVSIFALRQTTLHRRGDLWVRARARFSETSLLVTRIITDAEKHKNEWAGHFSASGNYHSDARIKKEADLDRIAADGATLRLRMPELPAKPPRFSSGQLEQNLASLESVGAHALALMSELNDSKSQLAEAAKVRRSVQMKGVSGE